MNIFKRIFSLRPFKYGNYKSLGLKIKFFNTKKQIRNIEDKINSNENRINDILGRTKKQIRSIEDKINSNENKINDILGRCNFMLNKLLERFFWDNLKTSDCSYSDFINKLFNSKKLICNIPFNNWGAADYYKILFKNSEVKITCNPKDEYANKILCFGTQSTEGNINTMFNVATTNNKLAIAEQGFFSTIEYKVAPFSGEEMDSKFSKIISFVFDDTGVFFDARRTNYLEQMLNDKKLVITEQQKLRARKNIDFAINNKLSKYNSQPIYNPIIGRSNVKKILVVDQTFNDASIRYGLTSEGIFKHMLEDAIKEHPEGDIIVKIHPDTKYGIKGHYTDLKAKENIFLYSERINPICLLNYIDEVYVCTSQLGFEALMCGKKVHVYGCPFYAGWGLTDDKIKCLRRTNTRSLEEIFYIFYILYSYYVNPDKQSRCEIEEALDYLLRLREEYFKMKGWLQ